MKNFVELIQRIHSERYSVVMNKIIAEKIPVAFLSVAPVDDAIKTVEELRKQKLNVVTLVTLDTPPREDSDAGFEIIHLGEFTKKYLRPKYIAVVSETDARVALKYISDCKVISINRADTENVYEIFMSHLTELREVYESLIDEESKKIFRGFWLGRISNCFAEMFHSSCPHYMTPGFIPKPGATVIDGGSYDGGTPLRFTERGYKVYGFEPDKHLFEVAAEVAKKNNFTVENMGLGSYEHEMKYIHKANGGTSLDADGSETANITTIDKYVREKNIERVDFIKLDVEGSELDVLKGAATTIVRFKPILAISAYHKPDDFWVLMNFVKSLNPEYEFAMRQYHVSIEDEPFAISNDFESSMNSLGLDVFYKNFNECCLLAR